MVKSKSLIISATAFCAALYASGSYLTAYISSPWGYGQFRPAIIIPAFFAIMFGPMPAGLGAAIGTFLCDSFKHGTFYIPSLVAAVPGNFIGFYLYGWLLKGKFNWKRFISSSIFTLIVANSIVAFLYVPTINFLFGLKLSINGIILLSISLIIWWFVTMLPFMLFLTPFLIKISVIALPNITPIDVRNASLSQEFPTKIFILSMLLPGIIMLFLGLSLYFTPLVNIIYNGLTTIIKPEKALLTIDLIKVMFILCGFSMTFSGILLNFIPIFKTKK
ncbi:MAG: ECF transporter S component [Nitrososphaerota archaeon]